MRKALSFLCSVILLGYTIAACSGGSGSMSMTPTPSAGMTNVSLSIGDAPPMNVTILRFEMQVTAASLQPADPMQAAVSLLKGPTEVELEHLQTEPAFLANLSVPAGTYNGLSATFSNPQMTILNQSTQTLTVGTQSCAPNEVCNLTPPLNSMSVSVEAPTAPFPITLASKSPLALLLHFDINASVQGDLSISPTISLTQVPALPSGEFEHFHVIGSVNAINSPNFTLQPVFGSQALTIATDGNTTYDFGTSCSMDNFSCIATGQFLKVRVKLMSDGTLLATEVKLFEASGNVTLQGVVISSAASQNQFQVVLEFMDDEGHQFGQVSPGFNLTIQPDAMATFAIDADGVTLPPGLSFASVQDISVGQVVRLHPTLPVTIGSMGQITVGADAVTLEASEITGTVAAVNTSAMPPNFMLGGLPSLLTKANITQLEVEPAMGTDFENVSGLSALNVNDTVSVAGLLFNASSGPVVIAERVEKRQPEGSGGMGMMSRH
jgi:Domain of unknown function (DUF5666)/Domain of unknown function (DUF4382)